MQNNVFAVQSTLRKLRKNSALPGKCPRSKRLGEPCDSCPKAVFCMVSNTEVFTHPFTERIVAPHLHGINEAAALLRSSRVLSVDAHVAIGFHPAAARL